MQRSEIYITIVLQNLIDVKKKMLSCVFKMVGIDLFVFYLLKK